MPTRLFRSLTTAIALCTFPLAAVAQAPLPGQAPSPEQILGHQPGASGWLAEWADIVRYMDALDAGSPMVRVERIGETVLGREMVMAIITSESNQRRLDEIRAGQAKLADPRGVSESELDRLISSQPAVAFIGASLHGNEIMATQMSMELAHDLATDPELQQALENVVVLLVPGMNPDGLDITRDWWMRTRGTAHQGAPMPWLYHHYVGHDNNRDFFMITQPETRAVTDVLYREWFPQVVFDVHQMGNRGARFFIPPFADPLNPNLDPLLVRLTNLVGVQMALDLTAAGKTGVSHQQTFDLWWHGGGRTVPARHNMVGILSEAASAYYGDPIRQSPEELRQPEVGSMFPEPWEGGDWTPRDIVEYELIAAKSLVNLLDRQRDRFVRNFVRLGSRQVDLGLASGVSAYVIPADQRDPGSAAELVNVLRRGGAEVMRADGPITIEGRTYTAGSWVIPTAQPYRAHVVDLLEPQEYPERRAYPGGPPLPPYDLAGWTLSMQMGVDAHRVAGALPIAALATTDSAVAPAGTVVGAGAAVAVDPRMNASHRAIHEALAAGGAVTFSAEPISAAGERWPAGTAVLSGLADPAGTAARWASEWGLNAALLDSEPAGRRIDRLRVGLYKPWTASMDEGWTRWLFEQWAVPFDTVKDARIRAGDLARDFDVIVVPDMSYSQMMRGLPAERSPAEYAGGLGDAGAAALAAFVNGGGTLVLLDSSSEFAIEQLGVPVRDLADDQGSSDPAEQWYAPGSLLRVRWDAADPVATGMPAEGAVFYARSPVFEIAPGASGVRAVATYPESGILMSGYAQREEIIAGKAALVVADVGAGKAVLFGFRPQHRAQPHLTFKALFNALYLR